MLLKNKTATLCKTLHTFIRTNVSHMTPFLPPGLAWRRRWSEAPLRWRRAGSPVKDKRAGKMLRMCIAKQCRNNKRRACNMFVQSCYSNAETKVCNICCLLSCLFVGGARIQCKCIMESLICRCSLPFLQMFPCFFSIITFMCSDVSFLIKAYGLACGDPLGEVRGMTTVLRGTL